jgi:hypothetical protein
MYQFDKRIVMTLDAYNPQNKLCKITKTNCTKKGGC